MVFIMFIITGVFGALLFTDWPAGFNTPQLSPEELKQLDIEAGLRVAAEAFRSHNMVLPEELRQLPPQPPVSI